jgi:hypothetical protein
MRFTPIRSQEASHPVDNGTFAGIAKTLYEYCRGIDRMDAELTLACFEPTAELKYSGMYLGDPAGFVKWLWPRHAAMVGHTHSITNILVEQTQAGRAGLTRIAATRDRTDPSYRHLAAS